MHSQKKLSWSVLTKIHKEELIGGNSFCEKRFVSNQFSNDRKTLP